ncbi:MAG: hypothetical protein PF541_02615 [Prolixibacteraceae bacterium]|jgi:hypothetical protein|nr:hypothetical protein [Prolixibacteraceae bacterium]
MLNLSNIRNRMKCSAVYNYVIEIVFVSIVALCFTVVVSIRYLNIIPSYGEYRNRTDDLFTASE